MGIWTISGIAFCSPMPPQTPLAGFALVIPPTLLGLASRRERSGWRRFTHSMLGKPLGSTDVLSLQFLESVTIASFLTGCMANTLARIRSMCLYVLWSCVHTYVEIRWYSVSCTMCTICVHPWVQMYTYKSRVVDYIFGVMSMIYKTNYKYNYNYRGVGLILICIIWSSCFVRCSMVVWSTFSSIILWGEHLKRTSNVCGSLLRGHMSSWMFVIGTVPLHWQCFPPKLESSWRAQLPRSVP